MAVTRFRFPFRLLSVTILLLMPVSLTLAAPSQPVSQELYWSVIQLSRSGSIEYRLEDGRHSRVLASTTDRYEDWRLAEIADLDGNGIPDALVLHFTGGALCCFEYLIASNSLNGITISDWFSLGDAMITDIVDLNSDGIPELITSDNRFAYFPDLSFAGSPFLPLILCRSVTGLYYDCTAQYPSYFRDSADQYESLLRSYLANNAAIQTPSDWRTPSEPFTYSLGLVGAYLRMADQDATERGWQRLRTLCQTCYSWLSGHGRELSEALRRVQPERASYMIVDTPR
jgi:hypothetical protein